MDYRPLDHRRLAVGAEGDDLLGADGVGGVKVKPVDARDDDRGGVAAGVEALGVVGAVEGAMGAGGEVLVRLARVLETEAPVDHRPQSGPVDESHEVLGHRAAAHEHALHPQGAVDQREVHTGEPARVVSRCVDEAGRLYLLTDLGFGLVHSADMLDAAARVEAGEWVPATVRAADLPQRHGYVQSPAAMKKAGQ